MWNRSDGGRRRGDARAGYYCCLLLSVIIKSLLITSYCADTWHSCLPYTFIWRLKASPGNTRVSVWTRCCVLTYREVIQFKLALTTFYAFFTRVSCNWSVLKRLMWIFARISCLQKSSTFLFNFCCGCTVKLVWRVNFLHSCNNFILQGVQNWSYCFFTKKGSSNRSMET